jgi:hypothetical protein
LWENNPARLPDQVFGWVIERDGGEIGGFLGVIPMRMKVGNEEISAIGGHSWMVAPPFRLYSLGLYQRMMALSQRHFLVVAATGETMNAIGNRPNASIARIPVPDFDRQFTWVIDSGEVLRWALHRRGYDGLANFTATRPVTAVVNGLLRLGLRGGGRLQVPCRNFSVRPIAAFTEEFNEFWARVKGQYAVTVVRDAAFLNWRHLEVPNLIGRTSILGCWDGNELCGYVAIQRRAVQLGYPEGHYVVTDLLYDRRRDDVLTNLINSAYEYAIGEGGSLFQVVNMSKDLAQFLLRHRPHVRTLANWPYWYKAPSSELASVCREQPWWPSGVDGEASV